MKQCTKCKEEKSLDDFHNSSQNILGKRWQCKACDRVAALRYRKKNAIRYKQSGRNYQIKKKYGLSSQDFDMMMNSQNNSCDICGTHIKDYGKDKFDIDHDHTTGKVRALLCGQCNTSLGLAKDDQVILMRMIEYLEEHSGVTY